MIWTIDRIDDADFGCEERMPGEPLMVLVTLLGDDGNKFMLEVPENWLIHQKLEEGDEWPVDISEMDAEDIKGIRQSEWMDKYLELLEELE